MTNQKASHFEHDELAAMLPWYVNKTLDEDDRRAVADHIKGCDECQREILDLQSLNEAIQSDAQMDYQRHTDIDKSLASVMSRIEAIPPQSSTTASEVGSIRQKFQHVVDLFSALTTPQWGATAVAGVLVAVIGSNVYFDQSDDDYSVLSASDIVDSSMRLAVEFSTANTEAQARSIIEAKSEALAQQIDIELSSNGVYTILLKEAVQADELRQLIVDLEKDGQIKKVQILPSQ